jgi:broad specificity phosphatase PhoE
MDVFLAMVRHGVTDWNEQGRLLGRAEIGLNARGRAQAAAMAAALAERRLDAVLASPQRRALETATPIAAVHGLAVRTEPGLAEVWVGRWQGKTYDELRAEPDALRYAADGTHLCDTIEDAAAVQRRAVAVLERLRGGSDGTQVCVVSHGDPIRLLLAHCLGAELAEFRRLRVDPGSLSLVRLDGHGAEVLTVNWRPSDG